ncbi:MAG: hypothetical protein JNN25_18845 [Candidatus Kapabacteria bacterium]|nr:hypothetical protein [Candidatus Kapabacteria bacterium]
MPEDSDSRDLPTVSAECEVRWQTTHIPQKARLSRHNAGATSRPNAWLHSAHNSSSPNHPAKAIGSTASANTYTLSGWTITANKVAWW